MQPVHACAAAPACRCPSQATKYRDFVSEASLLMLSLTEEANTPADQPVLARIADMVRLAAGYAGSAVTNTANRDGT